MNVFALVVFGLLVQGFDTQHTTGDSCIETLHDLRTEERMEIISVEVIEGGALAYTLIDQHHRKSDKTAILVCVGA
jgi:hypothetical protein